MAGESTTPFGGTSVVAQESFYKEQPSRESFRQTEAVQTSPFIYAACRGLKLHRHGAAGDVAGAVRIEPQSAESRGALRRYVTGVLGDSRRRSNAATAASTSSNAGASPKNTASRIAT